MDSVSEVSPDEIRNDERQQGTVAHLVERCNYSPGDDPETG